MLHQTPEIPNYTIISPLGSGTTGHVWLAKDVYGERRAIKVTHIDYLNVPDYQRRFKREVTAQQQLYRVSSHVARIFNYDEKHIPPYIIMDYINGADLNRLIATKEIATFNLMTRLHWIEALASTLTKAHLMRIPGDTHGIIHRDIKPQNIRIQGERPYLLDFSISLTSDVAVDSTQDAMTLRYAAPELAASEASDIFSFGLVAFEILYEQHPLTSFDEATTVPIADYSQYVLNKLVAGTWTFPHEITANFPKMNKPETQEALTQVFLKVLAIDPAERYETAKAFSDDLLSVLLGNPSNPAFQIYSSKLTTDNAAAVEDHEKYRSRLIPQIGVSEMDYGATEETRRFDDDEIELALKRSILAVDQSMSEVETVVPEETPEAEEAPIAKKRQSSILPLASTLGLALVFVALFLVSRNNSAGTTGNIINSPTALALSSEPPSGQTNLAVAIDQSATESPTATATITASASPSPTAIVTASASPTDTVTPSVTSTATASLTSTLKATATNTSAPTLTSTATASQTLRPSATATLTRTPKPTATYTVTPTSTSTLIPSPTTTFTPSPTRIPPSSTPIPTPAEWAIEQYVFTTNSITTAIAVVFMPRGCIISSNGEEFCLEQGVWIDLEPVSNDKYDLCSRIAACSRPAFGELFDPAGARANAPVVGVSQIMADQYCSWRNARLPSVVEWQLLVTKLPTAYKNIDEWTTDMNSSNGQSQMVTIDEEKIQKIWLEDSYLSDGLSFRCVQVK